MAIEEIVQQKRDEIIAIAAKHGAHHVRIFGSVARGESGPDSDVDFLIDMDGGIDYGGGSAKLKACGRADDRRTR